MWTGLKRPLVAILRGVRPDQILPVAGVLVEAGFEAIEVPLNSPDPFLAIQKLQAEFGDQCLCGAGTVLRPAEVERLAATGARLCVSPNTDTDVIRAAVTADMVCLPGVFTATEALSAAEAGATALKFFPASQLGPDGLKALRAVLPPGLEQVAVGGVSERDFPAYAAAGIRAYGLGSSIYGPDLALPEILDRAVRTVAAWDAAYSGAGDE